MSARTKTLIAALLLAGTTAANAAAVDFVVNNYGPSYGSFAGTDADSNGILTQSELTFFQFDQYSFGHHVTLPTLFGFGDFNLGTNTWIPNGSGWGELGSYFSWNGGGNSVHGSWADVSTTIVQQDVPEPASLALLGLGLAGLAAARRKKAA